LRPETNDHMKEQNYANHAKLVPGYHVILTLFLAGGLIASFFNTWKQYAAGAGLMTPLLIALLFIIAMLSFYFLRTFPLKTQDRAIRAEESLRYFILTHKQFDSRLTMVQVIALRFAPDEEFVALVDRAVNESLPPVEIKKAIKKWRADNHRM
jgi:hypothetical protein